MPDKALLRPGIFWGSVRIFCKCGPVCTGVYSCEETACCWCAPETCPPQSRQKEENMPKGSVVLGLVFGLLGGVATMLANAAGPVAQLYLLAMALPKYAFIGTSAWLFLIVNIIKIPFMVDLDIITLDSMSVSWWMFIPAVIGAGIAPMIVKYINQTLFERLVWFFIVLAGVRMLF